MPPILQVASIFLKGMPVDYKICALIPTYNHHTKIGEIVERLNSLQIPVFIVDDGSDLATQNTLAVLKGVNLKRLAENAGKGAAIKAGLNWVAELGYSHAFQIDADGQHCLDNIQEFLSLSLEQPQALISGKPQYDMSMPLARKIGRWFTHFWVWIETLSFQISDSMCGYRIYPVQASFAIMNKTNIGLRMDFDTEIMVRLYWDGTLVLMHPVKVSYPAGNLSNFDVVKDNWRITKMHTKLVFTMIFNLLKRGEKKISWAHMAERGSILGIMILAFCYRFLGRNLCTVIGAPVVLYFYLTGRKQRLASKTFLGRALRTQPTLMDGLRHFMSFFQMLLDKFAAWSGHESSAQIEYHNHAQLNKLMTSKQGGMMLVSHLGNMEFSRAVASSDHKKKIHVLLHTKNSKHFSKVMNYFNPQANLNILEVTEVGPDTIMYLKERIENGDWVIMAADRTPVNDGSRVTYVPFMNEDAAFSQGPYILASLLQCPVYTGFAFRIGSKYKVYIELFAEKIVLERGKKLECIKDYTRKFSHILEGYCFEYPYQWYNFFDFWRKIV